MGLVELLDQIRSEYINQLVATIDEKQAIPGTRIIAEPALRGEDGRVVVEGLLQLPVRTDVAVLQDDQLTDMFNVDTGSMLAFDAVEFDWGKTLHVEMGPFAWQGLAITMPDDPAYVWIPLQDWFWKWFNEDEGDSASAELLEAVHFLSDPVSEGDVVQFAVDLGSAPVAAFEEFLDAISASGVSLCAIGEVQGASE